MGSQTPSVDVATGFGARGPGPGARPRQVPSDLARIGRAFGPPHGYRGGRPLHRCRRQGGHGARCAGKRRDLDSEPSLLRRHLREGAPLGAPLIEGYVDSGFGELFVDLKDAKKHFGVSPRPSPLGTISKQKADGSFSHRLIQDMRRSLIHDAARLPERQVLPRPVDHTLDLSRCAHARRAGQRIRTTTLDFKDAFMSIPLDHEGRQYNCIRVAGGVRRRRHPLRPDEPETGTVVVWRVFGFDGRPGQAHWCTRAPCHSQHAQRRRCSPSPQMSRGHCSCTWVYMGGHRGGRG